MNAKITRELLVRLRSAPPGCCDSCGRTILEKDACYECKECDQRCCASCAGQWLNGKHWGTSAANKAFSGNRGVHRFSRPVLSIAAGDIFLCGPDRWGIHHVVLACGPLTPEPDMAEVLKLGAGAEVFGCETVESTQAASGENTHWYTTRSYFRRDLNGEAFLIGDLDMNSGEFGLCPEPVPVKVLLHPLRQGFNQRAFEHAVEAAAAESRRYGWSTCVRAFVSRRSSISLEDFPDEPSRAELLDELHRRWDSRPICATVAIKVWQLYFELCSGGDVDKAVRWIIETVPVYADATTPSALVKAVTKCGWVLHAGLDV